MSLSTPSVAPLVAERISKSNSPASAVAPRLVAEEQFSTALSQTEQPKTSWLDGFRRVTASGDFIPEIDGFRFIAIFVVILRHVSVLIMFWLLTSKEGLLQYGRHGVELFFVISGFILSTPFAMHAIQGGKQVSLKRYFTRRITPGAAVSAEPADLFPVQDALSAGQAGLKDLICSCFYCTGVVQGDLPHISTVTWSLEIEIQFYLLMPLIATLFWINRRWLRRGCMVALAVGFAVLGPLKLNLQHSYYTNNILLFLPYFLAGLMLADVYAHRVAGGKVPAVKNRGIGWGDAVWLVGWPLLLLVFMPYNLMTRLAVAAAADFPALFLGLLQCLGAKTDARESADDPRRHVLFDLPVPQPGDGSHPANHRPLAAAPGEYCDAGIIPGLDRSYPRDLRRILSPDRKTVHATRLAATLDEMGAAPGATACDLNRRANLAMQGS